ncbi:MAG TPA: glycine cleavage system protein GcvH [Chloroflexota bacterium]|nr:glycine cleavage system protein GcvH [Chloroflexota bacterium]
MNPADLRYTKEHEWVRLEGETATVGITDYAQGELGDVVFVELPEPGSTVKQGESFGVVESVKAASDLYAPVSGEVLETNTALTETPDLVNKESFAGGWMIRVRVSNQDEVNGLMDAQQYDEFLKTLH